MVVSSLSDENYVVDSLLNPKGEPKKFDLNISKFKIVYLEIANKHPGIKVDIVLNGNWAIAQFPELSDQRIRIRSDNSFHLPLRWLGIRQCVEEKDFVFISSNARFFGQRVYYSPFHFLLEELQTNGFLFLIITIIAGLAFDYIVTQTSNLEILKTANDIFIQVLAIFISIFILFTVSQNIKDLRKDFLFRSGLIHRFMLIDKYLAWEAIIGLLISISTRILIDGQNLVNFSLWSITVPSILAWITSFSLSIVIILLVSVVKYYMERSRLLIETEMSTDILNKSFDDLSKN